MRSVLLVILIAIVPASTLADDSDKASENSSTATDVIPGKEDGDALAAAEKQQGFKPPAGYRVKTRGDKTVYCRKDVQSGSRFAAERCYTKEQLAIVKRQNDEARREVERGRSICSNPAVCGST